jgi:hypothetical protein
MSHEAIEENVNKVQSISTALLAMVAEEYEGERPDFVLLGLLDACVKVTRLFKPEASTLECCNSVLEVLTNIRNGEATAVPCNQVGCEEKATHWYVWPTDGARKESCAKHTQKAVETLHVLGFELQAHPLIPQPDSDTESMGG